MQKQFLAIIIACLVLTGCMSSGPSDLSYGNCTNLCNANGVWWKTASTADLKAEIRSGANVNARMKDGRTPLHIAAAWGKPAHIKILVDAGAIVNARMKNGETPLHTLTKKNVAETIKVLVQAGADIEARDERGNTPLHKAALSQAVIVRALLNAGANPNSRNKLSESPFMKGEHQQTYRYRNPQWPEIANLLKVAGSDTKANTADVTKNVACGFTGVFGLPDLC
jgi:ankyrin repeat protein